jgi:RNA polymerase-interacting CarD/CdnL/TRCF family regulator
VATVPTRIRPNGVIDRSGRTARLIVRDMTLAVGDTVVYGGHGIAKITAAELGREDAEVVVLEFADGLSVTLRVDRARACLRPVSNETEMSAVKKTLGGPDSPDEETWQKRIKAAKSKVVDGEATGLAEVIRDGAHRAARSTPRGEAVRLSTHERELYLKARRLLAAEIGAARGIDPDEADAWIGNQLASHPEA